MLIKSVQGQLKLMCQADCALTKFSWGAAFGWPCTVPFAVGRAITVMASKAVGGGQPQVALVTGASGITGRHCVDALLQRGGGQWRVVTLARRDLQGLGRDDAEAVQQVSAPAGAAGYRSSGARGPLSCWAGEGRGAWPTSSSFNPQLHVSGPCQW